VHLAIHADEHDFLPVHLALHDRALGQRVQPHAFAQVRPARLSLFTAHRSPPAFGIRVTHPVWDSLPQFVKYFFDKQAAMPKTEAEPWKA
jgi:hypothetical protein